MAYGKAAQTETPREPTVFGIIAQFDEVDAVMRAARKVRDAGYQRWDVHSPFPIHGIDPAIGIRPTILPWIVLVCGIVGLLTGLFLTLYTMNPTDVPLPEPLQGYPYLISGKPYSSLPAYIPPIFELTILFSAFGAVFGMFLLNRLPLLSHPLLAHPSFKRATDDRFFVVIESGDDQFDPEKTQQLLQSCQPLSVETVYDKG